MPQTQAALVRRTMRWIAGGALALGLAGCHLLASPDAEPTQQPTSEPTTTTGGGPVELTSPIEFAVVEETAAAPCGQDYLAGPEGQQCFRLGDGVEVSELDQLELDESGGSGEEVLLLTMKPDDGEAFRELTAAAVQRPEPRIAMVVAGEVVSAPMLDQEIAGGQLQIAGWDGAADFVAEASGS